MTPPLMMMRSQALPSPLLMMQRQKQPSAWAAALSPWQNHRAEWWQQWQKGASDAARSGDPRCHGGGAT